MNDPVCDDEAIETLAKAVIDTELEAIQALTQRIDADFLKAIHLLLDCTGRIIVTGIGKSGHIGNKIAATFASTGSPAHFVHAAEASHGDMGMLKSGDVVIAISYSGSSDEILKLIPGIKRLNLPLIAISGDQSSALVKSSDVALSISVSREACPLGLAPTASTTATLVLGDALAVSLLHARGFSADDFARSHPGGRLGRRLLIHVSDVMAGGADTPLVQDNVTLAAALLEITKKGLGMVAVVDESSELQGIFTDGDLRRTIEHNTDFHTLNIADVMTHGGHTINPDELAVAAVSKMQEHQISSLPVVDDDKVVGIVTMHGLLTAGVV